MKFLTSFFTKKDKILVISGGGVRGFYALGILKAIEELDLKQQIKAVYGVSAGAIAASYRCAGYSAEEIFEKFISVKLFGLDTINLLSRKSLLKNSFLEDIFMRDLPASFDQCKIPLYIGATDIKKAKFVLFNEGAIIQPLLASIAIPGVFPPVSYRHHLLVDGGITNNFPVRLAKKEYPHSKVIGINLNKFVEDQSISSIFDNIAITYEILLRAGALEEAKFVDYLFYRDLDIKVLDTRKTAMKKIYLQGYEDAKNMFQK